MTKTEQLEKIAFIDHLTGLRNTNAFFHDFEGGKRAGIHLIYVDIDDFNKMSAVYGVDAVNNLVKEVAKKLVDYCGRSDVYRVGEDQFILVTKSHFICEPSELSRILRQPIIRHDIQYMINTSICVIDHDGFIDRSISLILKLMKFTIDESKRHRKNALIYMDEKLLEHYFQKREIEQNILDAVKNMDFYPMFEPYYDTFSNQMIGFDTVSRWDLNDRVIKPYEFLEIAEWTGLIYDIECHIFEESVKFLRELLDDKDIKLSSRFKASVNFSSVTLKQIQLPDLIEVLRKYKLQPKDIIIEIKEYYITDLEAYNKVKTLHAEGFLVSLDDYSNENSSLTYLADLKVDVIKLHQSLIQKLDDDQEFTRLHSIYEFLVDISKRFDLTVVSTGISKRRHIKMIKNLDIHIATGPYYSHAVNKEEFKTLFDKKIKRR